MPPGRSVPSPCADAKSPVGSTDAVDAEVLARWLQSDDPPTVLDLRTPLAYRLGHVPGAHPWPLSRFVRDLPSPHRDQRIVLVDLVGLSARAAAARLRTAGYDAVWLQGGMRAWWANDFPTLEGEDGPGDRSVTGNPVAGSQLRHLHGSEDYRRAFETLTGVPATRGNDVTVLRNGVEIFPAMLAAIGDARHTIDLTTYVYWSGDIARHLAETLAERARAGVRVRVLLDAVGSFAMPGELVRELRRAGARVEFFRPAWRLREANHRTHRKVLVCDGEVGFTGGVGIAEEWQGDARTPSEWRDTHFRIRGPAVQGLRAAFHGNWVETGNALVEDDERFPDLGNPGDVALQVLRSQPAASGLTDVEMVMRTMIRVASTRLRLTTAYFTPDRPFLRLLRDAAHRGVRVEVLIPGPHADKRFVQLNEHGSYTSLLEAGVRLYRFQPTMLHAKIATLDGLVALAGSANVNSRSLSKDDELCLVLHDERLVAALDRDFERDLERAEPVDLAAWRERGLLPRLTERAAGVLDPHL